jgi:hypothetical protein
VHIRLAWQKPEQIASLRLDERIFGRGHNFAIVLSGPARKRVLKVGANQTEMASDGFFVGVLESSQRVAVEVDSVEMSLAFVGAE